MTHDYHPGLPGFDETHVLQDGCEECERRSQADGLKGLLELDSDNLATIWQRARDRRRGVPVPASKCDLRLMNRAEEADTLIARLVTAGVRV